MKIVENMNCKNFVKSNASLMKIKMVITLKCSEWRNGGGRLATHFSSKGEIEISDFNFGRHECPPRRATDVNQVTMIGTSTTSSQ